MTKPRPDAPADTDGIPAPSSIFWPSIMFGAGALGAVDPGREDIGGWLLGFPRGRTVLPKVVKLAHHMQDCDLGERI